jgi:hypothetical protein
LAADQNYRCNVAEIPCYNPIKLDREIAYRAFI